MLASATGAHAQSVDGCTDGLYLDRTALGADRSLLWDFSFANDPERCLIVRVGQAVQWQGNFGDHPLDQDEGDRPNPIATHNNGSVTFTQTGVFGFRCNFHLSMRGAIKVLPALVATPVPALPAQYLWSLALVLLGLGLVQRRRRHVR